MLAGIFRTNQNYVLLILLLLAPTLWAISIYSGVDFGGVRSMPLYSYIDDWLSVVSWLPSLAGMLLLLLVAIMSNTLYNDLELFEKRDHLTALLFVILTAIADHAQSLNPALCAIPFIILAINKVTRLGESKQRLRVLFDVGLWLGIASFFYLPAILFTIPAMVMLPLLGRSEWREFFAIVFGGIFPFILAILIGIAFGNDVTINLWQPQDVRLNGYTGWGVATLLILFAVSVPAVISFYGRSIMRIKNYKAGIAGFMFLFALIGIVEIIAERPGGFTLLAFPCAYYSSYLFRQLRSIILLETIFTIVLAIAFWMQWSFINP